MTTKITFSLFILVFIGLLSCKTNQLNHSAVPETGMFRVAILYPNGEGKTFDLDYYADKHMPMVARLLGDNLKFYEIDTGIAGRTPNEEAPFAAIGYFYVTDVAEYNKAIGENINTIVSDFENYTNIQPLVQISEVSARWSDNP